MEDEEMNEETQSAEEGDESRKLRDIERSNLRGAQGRATAKKRRSVKTGQKHSAGKQVAQGRPKRRQKSNTGKKAAIFFALVAIIVLFLLTTIFATARLEVTLSSAEVSVDGVFQTVREPAQSKDISYQRLGAFEARQEAPITNGTRERQNTRAEGTVVLYNVNPSGESLDLINRTRLQSESGKIYRLVGKHVIPGGKTVKGKFVPGSKEVKIEANDFGKDFNLPNIGTRLSVPGLAKWKEFAKTYATTSSKIVGGFSGERFIPDSEEAAKIREQLQRDIEKKLRDELAQSVANNSLSERVVFEEGIFITFESLSEEQGCKQETICEKGTLYAISFRETELAALLVKYAPASIQSVLPARIEAKGLSMNIEKSDEFEIVSSTEFSFRLSGSAKLFWDIDTALLTSDMAGKNRKEVADILTNEYPQVIQHETPSIFPAWRNTLPGNKEKINIETKHLQHSE
ncbi:MAG: hypothetical protein OXB96_01525 [Candidatus Kaiserbacteria bacterium]|nr:hypothetical protein [Candidatus Kaiserbacteria bacterium]